MLQQLVTPLNFLRIQFRAKKKYFLLAPFLFAAAILLLYYLSSDVMPLMGPNGIIQDFSKLLPILIGFYIAALAAIATMNKETLDEEILGESVTLSRRYRGTKTDEALSRRRFLCYLFSYNAFLSIVLYFAGVVSPYAAFLYRSIYSPLWAEMFKISSLSVYFIAYGNLIAGTLFGLHYLADRLHRTD